jgi:hypothetical protein
MGYAGEYFTQKQHFKKFLDNNNIPYEEIIYNDSRFLNHPVMIKEIEQTHYRCKQSVVPRAVVPNFETIT